MIKGLEAQLGLPGLATGLGAHLGLDNLLRHIALTFYTKTSMKACILDTNVAKVRQLLYM